MKIGIIGSGMVGQTLALGFEKHNYSVMIGSRSSEKLSEWKNKTGFKGNTGNFDEVAFFGEILILAVKASIAEDVLKHIDSSALRGKLMIDPTNPIADEPPVNCVIKYFTRLDLSLMEQLQKKFPEIKFVKAFSCIGSAFMVNPDFGGLRPTMFICGNDGDSKQKVSLILHQFGFEVEDMGASEAARAIEPLCMLWCIPGFVRNEWNHGFKLLKK
jgi:predicted dinucleotide-binding enzyme